MDSVQRHHHHFDKLDDHFLNHINQFSDFDDHDHPGHHHHGAGGTLYHDHDDSLRLHNHLAFYYNPDTDDRIEYGFSDHEHPPVHGSVGGSGGDSGGVGSVGRANTFDDAEFEEILERVKEKERRRGWDG